MDLVLFDLDHTLLDGDSDASWTQFLVQQGDCDSERLAIGAAFYADYLAGTLDMRDYLAFSLAPLAAIARPRLFSLRAQFMDEVICPMISTKARALVAQHQQAGAWTAIITATNQFVAAPIAAELGIVHLIATQVEEIEASYTGRSIGVPCYQADKITRLNEWLHSVDRQWGDFEFHWFYSDSHNDLPLLKKVDYPVVVNPDPTLKKHATAAHWPVMDLR